MSLTQLVSALRLGKTNYWLRYSLCAQIIKQCSRKYVIFNFETWHYYQPCVQGTDVYNLLEPDIGEISMELATPLQPTRMILDVNNPDGSHTPYLDPLFIPLPPSPDNH